MPAYKDSSGKWYCKFYYKDYQGISRQKKKSGFALKKEALAWERDFLERHAQTNNISFDGLVDRYLADLKLTVKESTFNAVNKVIGKHIKGAFSCPAAEVTPLMIKEWQHLLKDKGLAANTIKNVHSRMSAVFNWGINYCDLQSNPAKSVKVNAKNRREYVILTLQQWKEITFDSFSDKVMFDTLFYTGMRVGEMLALTIDDVDFVKCEISITKTYTEAGKITTPKTENSSRKVLIPKRLAKDLEEYRQTLYSLQGRLFPISSRTVLSRFKRILEKNGLPDMRVHDIRHSHASLMINKGCNILLVAERLGDTPTMALSTYSHLYPNKQAEFIKMIE